jgi:hypothetical protein
MTHNFISRQKLLKFEAESFSSFKNNYYYSLVYNQKAKAYANFFRQSTAQACFKVLCGRNFGKWSCPRNLKG